MIGTAFIVVLVVGFLLVVVLGAAIEAGDSS